MKLRGWLLTDLEEGRLEFVLSHSCEAQVPNIVVTVNVSGPLMSELDLRLSSLSPRFYSRLLLSMLLQGAAV